MNIQELRIGNYVSLGGVPAMVTAIYSDSPDSIKVKVPDGKTMEITANDAHALPLTMELVSRCCGFDPRGRLMLGIDHDRYYLRVQDDFICLLNRQNEAIIHFWDVKNLHQLQNLYFALKGTEMDVAFVV